jgi:hypothetical protein
VVTDDDLLHRDEDVAQESEGDDNDNDNANNDRQEAKRAAAVNTKGNKKIRGRRRPNEYSLLPTAASDEPDSAA